MFRINLKKNSTSKIFNIVEISRINNQSIKMFILVNFLKCTKCTGNFGKILHLFLKCSRFLFVNLVCFVLFKVYLMYIII